MLTWYQSLHFNHYATCFIPIVGKMLLFYCVKLYITRFIILIILSVPFSGIKYIHIAFKLFYSFSESIHKNKEKELFYLCSKSTIALHFQHICMSLNMYTYGWFMLRFDRKQKKSVKQLSFNKNKLIKNV